MASSARIGSWIWRWGPVVAWMAGLFWGSALLHRPSTPGLEGLTWDDKLQHTVAYAILAALAWRALGPRTNRWLRVAIAVLVAVGYGAFDECHQHFVPNRQCSFQDWSADSTGAALAGILLGILGGDGHGRTRERREDLRGQG